MGSDGREGRDGTAGRPNAAGDDDAQAATARGASHRHDARKFRDDPSGDCRHEADGPRTRRGKPSPGAPHRPGHGCRGAGHG